MSLARKLMEKRIAHGTPASGFRGVEESEIAALETELGAQFPEVYRDYLSVMGREPGGCGKSVDIRFGCLGAVNREFLEAASHLKLGFALGDVVAIYANQGADYLYFRADEARADPDPPLRRLRLKKGASSEGCPSISDYLERLLTGDIILDEA